MKTSIGRNKKQTETERAPASKDAGALFVRRLVYAGSHLPTVCKAGFSCFSFYITAPLRSVGDSKASLYFLALSAGRVGAIVKMGLPIALQSMSGTAFHLMIQRLVNSFGEAMTASYAVVSRVEGMMNLPASALYQTLPTYTAQNMGAGKPERIRAGLRHAVAMSLMITFILLPAAFACAPFLAESFGVSGLSARYCAEHIRRCFLRCISPVWACIRAPARGWPPRRCPFLTCRSACCWPTACGRSWPPAIGPSFGANPFPGR